jgi:hypothetical protein
MGARWWQWLLNIPVPSSPVYDDTGANCGVNQSGKVWFLAGTFTSFESGQDVVGSATRSCNIPAGKSIFFPILNTECSTIEGNGKTYKDLLSCAVMIDNAASSLEADVDGVQIAGLNPSNSPYRAHSGLYYFTLPDNNLLQNLGVVDAVGGTKSKSVSDGWWLMLAPLSAGSHVIHFHGEVPLSGTGYFKLDITYNLNVAQ